MWYLTREARNGSLWELVYRDDLVLMAKSEQKVTEAFKRWKEAVEIRRQSKSRENNSDVNWKGD